MPTYCIMCGEQRQGLPVENDYVIDAIRWFKRNITKDEQNNKLVVCKEDYPKYKKNRDKYTTRRMIYVGLGVLFLLLGLALSFRITTFIAGMFVVLFLYLMSLLNYTPKLQVGDEAITSKKDKHNQ